MAGFENLLNLVFPEGFPADWSYNVDFKEYIAKIGNYKLNDLAKQPSRLSEERKRIVEHTQELAVNNYKTFIETGECSKDVFTEFHKIETNVEKLLINIPKFEENCEKFSEISTNINTLRKLNTQSLMRSSEMLEILELPSLMTNFIEEDLFEEALELSLYVKRLYNRYPDVKIFKSISDDVDKKWLQMLHTLLGQLRQDLTLPKCLQIVSHLRRMEVFSEAELRLKFLQTRDIWLKNCLKLIPQNENKLSKTIEITRVNLFNIITQYRAIFNDDEHSPLASIKKTNQVNQNMIFFSWIKDKISEFLETLQDELQHSTTSIETVLAQCMYFGASFSKVGCDFRSSLIPIFTQRIESVFINALNIALYDFEKNMQNFTLLNRTHPNIPFKLPAERSDDNLQPPESLAEFYPLAEFLNQTLNAFNALKICAPFASLDVIVTKIESVCAFLVEKIRFLYGQEHQGFNANSKEAFTRFCMCFADDFLPYLQKCIHVVFPPALIATHLGVSVQFLYDAKISFLSREVIVKPIENLLPIKMAAKSVLLTDEALQ